MSLPESAGVHLGPYTSLAVGGQATEFHEPSSIAELARVLADLEERGLSPYLLGGGCNTLFSTSSCRRPVVHTGRLGQIEVAGTRIRAQAGVRLETLMKRAIREGLGGLEMFGGIPGTVGGAIAMNAGGSGFSFGELVSRLTVVEIGTGRLLDLDGRDVEWGYRTSSLGDLVVAEAELTLVKRPVDELRRRSLEFIQKKAASQPLGSLSAGCVFRNPPGQAAARLIDEAGLKGERVGSALVSPVHANFIVNADGKARGEDVLSLIRRIQERVLHVHGVELELEIVVADEARPEPVTGAW